MPKSFCFPIQAFEDNYIWILGVGKEIIIVDPGDAEDIIDLIKRYNYEIKGILLTHHHQDHIGGVQKIRHFYKKNFTVYGPKNKLAYLIDKDVSVNKTISIKTKEKDLIFEVIKTPGHTLDHVCYYQKKEIGHPPRLFCGDTLFSCGCGRLFECDAKQLFNSLKKLTNLPDETLIYCGHEYTLANIQFAKYMDRTNNFLKSYEIHIKKNLEQGKPTVPSRLKTEKKINPFLRIRELNNSNKKDEISEEEYFKYLRKEKDNFPPIL